MNLKFTLNSSQRLRSKTEIDEVFTGSTSIRKGNIRAVFIYSEKPQAAGFSVSKRYFKKAVDRNRVKRLIREAYRLKQHDFKKHDHLNLRLMFLYQSNKMPEFNEVDKWMKAIMAKIKAPKENNVASK